jgi:hypothetical protein
MRQFLVLAAATVFVSAAGLAQAAAAPAAPPANQFANEADAKARCPADQIVWANNGKKSKIYHLAGDKYYGKTRHGAYMCQKDSEAEGFRAAKARHPVKSS